MKVRGAWCPSGSSTGRCQSEHLSLMSTGVGEEGKHQVPFGDGGEDFVVEVGSERLDVIDVFTELIEPDLRHRSCDRTRSGRDLLKTSTT